MVLGAPHSLSRAGVERPSNLTKIFLCVLCREFKPLPKSNFRSGINFVQYYIYPYIRLRLRVDYHRGKRISDLYTQLKVCVSCHNLVTNKIDLA